MTDFTIVLGDRNTSSWSLRGWLAFKQTGAAFDEIGVSFKDPDVKTHILAHSPSGMVPMLKHLAPEGEVHVWESLAIIESLAELYPDAGLWPEDRAARLCAHRQRRNACRILTPAPPYADEPAGRQIR